MIDLSIQIPELQRLIRRFEQAPALVAEEVARATEEAAEEVQTEVLGRTPRGETGRLGNTLRVEVQTSGSEFTATITTGVPYARFVEEGTRPHVIEPRRKKALAFRGRGGRIVRRRVMHPGTRGVFFMRRGWEASQPHIRRRYANALQRVARRLRGG